MKKLSKEAKIGIAFIISLFILYFGINFLKGINIFKPANSYIVAFDDVTGLTLSSPVLVNGYQVGLVHSMNLAEDGKTIITVINLNKGVKIPVGSQVKLDVAALGGASVIIEQNPMGSNYISTSDTIKGVRMQGLVDMFSKDMGPKISNYIPKIDSILSGIQMLVYNPALHHSLNNVETLTRNLESSTIQLNQLIIALNKDVPAITHNLNNATKDLSHTSSQFKSINLVSTYQSIDSTMRNLNTLSNRLTEKNNSLGLLVNDRQLYDSLNMTISNASLLLKDIKENPSKYINVKVF